MKRLGSASVVALLFVFAIQSVASATSLALPPAASVDSISPTELRMHLEFLASPEVGGRYTLSPGLNIAARYLASRLESYGYHGASANGSFMQPYDVVSSRVDTARTTLSLTIDGKERSVEYGDFASFSDSSGDAAGPIVFVGYGISSPSQKHDDYVGLDVKGKIVLYASGVPSGVDSSKIKDDEKGSGAARAHGAVGTIALPQPRYAAFMKGPQFKEFLKNRENISLKNQGGDELPGVFVMPSVADELLAPLGLSLDKVFSTAKEGGVLAPATTTSHAKFSITVTSSTASAQNVAGVLEGSDPVLKNEYVVLSAHYDHLKTNAKGEIYPGADDDGSGTAAVLTLARAFSLQRPKRSILVMFHSGEELGLLGSEYNTDVAPVIPLDKLVVDLNIDMIGRSRAAGDENPRNKELTDANSIYLIGADKLSKELNSISEQTNDDTVKMRIDYTYNDPNHPDQFYYRSDHWNYAKHGIPVIFYFSGVHQDYHQTSDTVDKIDFDKMARVSRLVFATAWRIANLDHRLVVDQR